MATYRYFAILYKQRETAQQVFCVAAGRVGEIQSWARVDRLTPDNKFGVQRARKDARVDAIEDFLKADARNTVPTSIIIALPKSVVTLNVGDIEDIGTQPVSAELIVVTEDDNPQPGLIIDGQHRTFGMAQFDPTTIVNLVFIVGATDDEVAFQFVVINNKVSKVSPDHIKALKLGYSDDNLDARLTKSASMKSSGAPAYLDLIDTQETSPFKGRLKWPRNQDDGTRSIPLNAFEMGMLAIASQKLDQASTEGPNPDFVVRFFLEIWSTVHNSWSSLWNEPTSKLTRKVGIVCMTEYLVSTMVSWSMVPGRNTDLTDLNNVNLVTLEILEQQEMAFWTSEWSDTSLDTKSGREWVVDTLEKIQFNKFKKLPWNAGIRLVVNKSEPAV